MNWAQVTLRAGLGAVVAVALLAAVPAKAATIVNVDAGPAYAPVVLTLAPGTYKVTPIGTGVAGALYDAWSAWAAGADVAVKTASGGTAQGWLNSYVVLNPDIVLLSPIPPGAGGTNLTPGTGYQAHSGFVYPTAAEALAEAVTTFFLLPTTASSFDVTFANLDGTYDGNRGGNSLYVEKVPLPPALPLFATGLLGLGLLHWRRRRTAKSA
jgi:hypothetical protein